MKYTILFFIGFLVFSCGKKKEDNLSITMEEMEELVKRTTNIDYIFYELPMSMNLDNQGAINSALRQISDQPAKITANCKPMGRVIFQDQGDIFKEADFYYAAPCFGFVWIEGTTKVSSNMMTEEGATFFGNLLQNAAQQQGQQQGPKQGQQ